MKYFKQPDGLEGYVVLVEEEDLKKPLDLTELKGDWIDIINRCEGVVQMDGLFHCVYLTNNEFAIEILFPDAEWLPQEVKLRLHDHLI
jgi:hypothetical protein